MTLVKKHKWEIFLSVLIFSLVAVAILLASVPPVSRDALTHHLYVPNLYLMNGGIYEIPHISFSYYPMLLDYLYLFPLYLGNDILPKYIHLGFAVLTAWLIYSYLKRRLNHFYGLYGSLFFLSIPVILKLSITVYVDLGLICFSTCSILLIFSWVETKKIRLLMFAGISCGLAASTKYNGLLVLSILTLFVVFISSKYLQIKKDAFLRPLLHGIVFLAAGLVVFSPWMIRNYQWTNNPVYPLYNSVFKKILIETKAGPTVAEVDTEINKVLQQKTREGGVGGIFGVRKNIYGESLLQIVLLPVRVFFEGKDDNPQYFDGKLNPFLLLLPVVAFVFRKRYVNDLDMTTKDTMISMEKSVFVFFTVVYFLFVFFLKDMRIRWISPIIPSMLILAVYGLHDISRITGKVFDNRKKMVMLFISFFLIAPIIYNVQYLVQLVKKVQPLTFLSGSLTREKYIEKYRPEYPVIRYANNYLLPDSKIMGIFLGLRGYYFRNKVLFGSNHFSKYIKSDGTVAGLWQSFQEKGITHLIIRDDFFFRYVVSKSKKETQNIIKSFFSNHTITIFQQNGHTLYELKNDKME